MDQAYNEIICCLCYQNVSLLFMADHLYGDHKIKSNCSTKNLNCTENNCAEFNKLMTIKSYIRHINLHHISKNKSTAYHGKRKSPTEFTQEKREYKIASKIDSYVCNLLKTHKHTNQFVKDIFELIQLIAIESNCVNLIRSIDHITFHKKENYINKLILPLANKEQIEQSANMIKQYGYHIDIKETLFNYINLFNIKINDGKIPLILYFDDIACNNILGSHKKNCEMTHSAVKIFNEESHQKSSLQNYLTFATTEKKYAKKDNYSTFVNQCVKIINSSSIYLNGRENQLYVHCIIGDHVVMQQIFKKKLNFGSRGHDQCRCCTISASNYSMFLTCSETNKFIRPKHTIEGIPLMNHTVSDPFHDLSEGICKYMLFASVNLFLSLSIQNAHDLPEKLLEIATNFRNDGEKVSSILNDNFFVPKTKKFEPEKKGYYPLSGSETQYVTRLFYEYIKDFVTCNTSNNMAVLKELTQLLHSLLSIMYILKDNTEENLELIISICEKFTDAFFVSLFKIFNKDKFKMSIKFHFILHYGIMIRHFGHPLNLSCKRFESLNSKLKQNLILSRNSLNPSLTALRKIVWNEYLSNNTIHEKKRGKISDMRLSWDYDIIFIDSNFPSDFNQTNDVNNLTILINNTIEDEENE